MSNNFNTLSMRPYQLMCIVCRIGAGIERGPEWRVCGGKEGGPDYLKARKKRLNIRRHVVRYT